MSKESTSRRRLGQYMRPNIQISHQLNGRVKDYAADNDMTVDQAYRQIIKAGLEQLQSAENNNG